MDRSTGPTVFFAVLAAMLACRAAQAQDPALRCARGGDTNASVVVPEFASITLNDRPVTKESRIEVVTPDGVCAGAVVWNGTAVAFAVWEDDPGLPERNGLQAGDLLRFRIWDPVTRRAYEARSEIASDAHSGERHARYEADAVYVVHVLSADGSRDDPPLRRPELRLLENFPNPFSSATTIPFEVPKPAPVVLEVFNTVGARVATLIDGSVLTGRQEFRWSPDYLPAGLYVIRLKTGDAVQTRSVVHIE